MTWWLWVPVAAVGLFVLDRLLLAAERRRWIFYRTTAPQRSTAGNALLSLQAIFEPDKQHVVDERTAIDADQPGDDEPPRIPDSTDLRDHAV
jgi:hypothetical protein